MARRKRNPMQIFRIDGKDSFVEVLGGMIDKGKIQVNFVEYDPKNGNKQTAIINTYINLPLFMGFVEGVLSGEFRNRINEAKTSKYLDGQPVNAYTSYFASMGGVNEESVAKNFETHKAMYPWLAEGQAISRQFKVQVGSKYPYVLRGEVGVGKSNDKGLIVPQGTAKKYINIPIPYEQMMALAATTKAFVDAYYAQLVGKMVEKGAWKWQMEEYDFGHLTKSGEADG